MYQAQRGETMVLLTFEWGAARIIRASDSEEPKRFMIGVVNGPRLQQSRRAHELDEFDWRKNRDAEGLAEIQ